MNHLLTILIVQVTAEFSHDPPPKVEGVIKPTLFGIDCYQDLDPVCYYACVHHCQDKIDRLDSVEECISKLPNGCPVLISAFEGNAYDDSHMQMQQGYPMLPDQKTPQSTQRLLFQTTFKPRVNDENITYDFLHFGAQNSLRPDDGFMYNCNPQDFKLYWHLSGEGGGPYENLLVQWEPLVQSAALAGHYRFFPAYPSDEWKAWLESKTWIASDDSLSKTQGILQTYDSLWINLPSECAQELQGADRFAIIHQWSYRVFGTGAAAVTELGAPLPQADGTCRTLKSCGACNAYSTCNWCQTVQGPLCSKECRLEDLAVKIRHC